jgi:hypothetical protein
VELRTSACDACPYPAIVRCPPRICGWGGGPDEAQGSIASRYSAESEPYRSLYTTGVNEACQRARGVRGRPNEGCMEQDQGGILISCRWARTEWVCEKSGSRATTAGESGLGGPWVKLQMAAT